MPDEKWGEAIKAVVVLKKGATEVSAEALIDFCTHDLGRFKKPRSIDFVDALPKNANGKVLRRKVREPFWKGKESRVI